MNISRFSVISYSQCFKRTNPHTFSASDAFFIIYLYAGFVNRDTVRLANCGAASASVANVIFYNYLHVDPSEAVLIYSSTFSLLK